MKNDYNHKRKKLKTLSMCEPQKRSITKMYKNNMKEFSRNM